jgi:hypothetical protein
MSTGYTLTIGYLSGHSTKLDKDEAWQELVRCVEQLRVQPERIVQEARRLNAPETCEEGCCTLLDMAQAYQHDDGTLVLNHQEHYILQLASGDRMLKEHVRRAFCRLVIEEMHRQGIEVCLQVS